MTIPAGKFVTGFPNVISAGGNPLSLNSLYMTSNPLMPSGQVLSFPSTTNVGAFFGLASDEYALSLIYFAGYVGATLRPGAMLFASYNTAARAAWLTSGSLAGLTLTQLQALAAGTLTITIDGTSVTSASINLSAATSFSNAATLIAAGFAGLAKVPTVVWNSVNSTFLVTSPTTGSASSMTYATASTLATGLDLTKAAGSTLSQGGIADTPASAATAATNKSQNFATISLMAEPVLADKEGWAIWANAQNNRYQVVIWDTDVEAVTQGSTTAFGVIADNAGYNGIICISGDPALAVTEGVSLSALVRNAATFYAGMWASVNFGARNGRITAAYKSSGSIQPTCDDLGISDILDANGYSYYAAAATANQPFDFFYSGAVPGVWKFADPYINQIWLNANLQQDWLNLLASASSIGYNPPGYGQILAASLDSITDALTFGAIRTGVILSAEEIAQVTAQAGQDISSPLQTLGWYMQILDPGAEVRAERGSPIINFWYTDGGAVQQITFTSTDIL